MRNLPLIVCSLVLVGALAHAQINITESNVTIGAGLEPLTPVERALAVQIAQESPSVYGAIAGMRNVPIGASLALPDVKATPPTPDGGPLPVLRRAEVQFYVYDRHETLTALVDLTELRVLSAGFELREPVLVLAELQAAKPILLADPDVQALVGDMQGVELINAGLAGGSVPCELDRCFRTGFVRVAGGDAVNLEPVPGVVARFNLSSMTVDAVYLEDGL